VNRAADIRLAEQWEPAKRDAFAAQLKSWRARMEWGGGHGFRTPMRCRGVCTRQCATACWRGQTGASILLFASARTIGLAEEEVEAAACAVELVHVVLAVHDDLPAMDDDDLRRGRPTCHKAYDEATAVLVGDALQPLAFSVTRRDPALPPRQPYVCD